jgi:hypothetical protein
MEQLYPWKSLQKRFAASSRSGDFVEHIFWNIHGAGSSISWNAR